MKLRSYPVIAILLIFACLFAACGEESASAGIPAETAPDQTGGSITVPAVSAAPSPTQTPLPAVKLEPAPTAPPTPTPSPIPTIGPYFEPTVRKSPWPEVCIEGSTIYFTAFADNCLKYDWQLEKDHIILDWKDMPETFSGMKAAGLNGSYLVLANVPAELDGWSVRCVFTGSGDGGKFFCQPLQLLRRQGHSSHCMNQQNVVVPVICFPVSFAAMAKMAHITPLGENFQKIQHIGLDFAPEAVVKDLAAFLLAEVRGAE